MQRLLMVVLAALFLGATTGCIIPAYSGDPVRRTQELIFTSENLRQILEEWERAWFLDQPSHMTPYRVHGGII
jgi:ABC-type dipeptide/oligopeptide/nickel transport system permease component